MRPGEYVNDDVGKTIVELSNRRMVELKNADQRMTEITNLIALIPADIESLEEVRVKYHLIEEQEG